MAPFRIRLLPLAAAGAVLAGGLTLYRVTHADAPAVSVTTWDSPTAVAAPSPPPLPTGDAAATPAPGAAAAATGAVPAWLWQELNQGTVRSAAGEKSMLDEGSHALRAFAERALAGIGSR